MVLLYRFRDMDSMRDPHIYCNQHSDQNMACVINMVGCHGQQSPPGASAYLTAIVITGSTGGCRNYGVYAAGVTGLWNGWCVGLVPMVLLFWRGRWAYNQGSHVVL